MADTSVVINLNATGCVGAILTALPHRLVIVDVVVDELETGVRKGRPDAAMVAGLVKADLIEVVRLGSRGLQVFEGLVIGAASETLDDGEAATLAHAAETNMRALIDERKAIRLSAARFRTLQLGSTVDVLAHRDVQRALGSSLADAVHRALIGARMRVVAEHMDWVVSLIGDKRTIACPSLPEAVRKQASDRL